MISIALIVMISSIASIKVNQALYKHSFEANIKKISTYFELCSKLAFANQADIYLILSQREEKVFLEIRTDNKTGLFKDQKTIKDIFKNFQFFFNEKKEKDLEIIFSSTNQVMPKGHFVFKDKKQKFIRRKSI